MSTPLLVAAGLAAALAVAHSWLGERFLVSRLLRLENLPRIRGSRSFTANTIRFAWHLTTVAWIGLAVILVLLSGPAPGAPATRAILLTITLTFLVSSILSAVGGRMRHFSWWVLLAISALVTASLW